MLFGILVFIFIIVCIILCFLILIQSDKGGGISGALGGGLGGASSLLGTQDTANILTRGTTIFASIFFLLCVVMALVMSKQTVVANKSLLQQRAEKQQDFSPSSVLDKGALPIQSGSGNSAAAVSTPAPLPAGSTTEGGTSPLPIVPPAEEKK